MATWSGWQGDLIRAAGLPDVSDVHTFLTDWAAAEKTGCTNNPLVISRATATSTKCKKLTDTRTAQNYPSSAIAADAFSAQLHSGNFGALLDALKSGTPFQVTSPHDVEQDLVDWGAVTYAFELQQNYGPSQPEGSGGGGAQAPKLHGGWKSMRHSFNHSMPRSLHASHRSTQAALRELGRVRKVKL